MAQQLTATAAAEAAAADASGEEAEAAVSLPEDEHFLDDVDLEDESEDGEPSADSE